MRKKIVGLSFCVASRKSDRRRKGKERHRETEMGWKKRAHMAGNMWQEICKKKRQNKLTPEVVVRYGRLRQDVGAAGERDVEVVQDRQGVRGPMLLHQQVLQKKLPSGRFDVSTGESGTRVSKTCGTKRTRKLELVVVRIEQVMRIEQKTRKSATDAVGQQSSRRKGKGTYAYDH